MTGLYFFRAAAAANATSAHLLSAINNFYRNLFIWLNHHIFALEKIIAYLRTFML